MQNAYQDRRLPRRIRIDKEIRISYSTPEGSQSLIGYIQDVSDTGMSFFLKSSLELPSSIKIEVESEIEKLSIPSTVTWRKNTNTVFGVEFGRLSEARISALRGIFADLNREISPLIIDRRVNDRRSGGGEFKREFETQKKLVTLLRRNLKHRVVITGVGVISPIGLECGTLWKHIVQGKSASGVFEIKNGDNSKTVLGAQVSSFDPNTYMDPKRVRRMHRHSQLACAAALLAMQDSKLKIDKTNSFQCGVFEGTSMAGIEKIFDEHRNYLTKGPSKVNPLILLSGSLGDSAAEISLLLKLQGPSHTLCTGSASSADAIGTGYRAIQDGHLEAALVGGSESPLLPEIMHTFANFRREPPPESRQEPRPYCNKQIYEFDSSLSLLEYFSFPQHLLATSFSDVALGKKQHQRGETMHRNRLFQLAGFSNLIYHLAQALHQGI